MIVKKADFLSEDQRSIWLFFSAKVEQEKIEEAARVERILELAALNLLNESD